jgi:hypothetical protein
MFAMWFLFETRLRELFLALLEQRAGLAVVRADWLGMQHSSEPKAAGETR